MKPTTDVVLDVGDVPTVSLYNVRDDLQVLPLADIQQHAKDTALPFAVALANIAGDLNVGNIIRSACVFGAEQVFVFGRKRYDRRSAVGSHHYVPVQHYVYEDDFDWSATLHTIRLAGYTPILIEQAGRSSLDTFDVDRFHPVCLVFGTEHGGIPAEVCADEQCYYIQQPGVVRSLNVATAAGIAMYHVMRQLHPWLVTKYV